MISYENTITFRQTEESLHSKDSEEKPFWWLREDFLFDESPLDSMGEETTTIHYEFSHSNLLEDIKDFYQPNSSQQVALVAVEATEEVKVNKDSEVIDANLQWDEEAIAQEDSTNEKSISSLALSPARFKAGRKRKIMHVSQDDLNKNLLKYLKGLNSIAKDVIGDARSDSVNTTIIRNLRKLSKVLLNMFVSK